MRGCHMDLLGKSLVDFVRNQYRHTIYSKDAIYCINNIDAFIKVGDNQGFIHFEFIAHRCENLNLKLETSEIMDQFSIQHVHVVTIPSTTNASSIVSSNVVATAVSTSIANTQGQSHAPQQQRSIWSDPCMWLTFDLYSTSIQITLLTAFLSVFQDEYAHMTLQIYVIGCGIGHMLYCNLKCIRELRSLLRSNQLPQVVSVSLGSIVGESQTSWHLRFGKILLKFLWRLLDGFFYLWIGVGTGIVYTHWKTRQTPHLNWLCTIFLAIACFGYILILMDSIIMNIWCGIRILKANVISALPMYKFYAQVFDLEANQANNKEDNNMKDSIEGDPRVGALTTEVVECCICLDPIEEGVELKELPCMHNFHVKCIDRWLKINESCPICKSEVGTSIRAFENEPTFEIVMV